MTILCRIFAVLLCAATPVFAAGGLTINPGTPAPGNMMTLKYKPDDKLKNRSELYAVVYSFRETSLKPTARQAQLRFDRTVDAYIGEFRLDTATVFGMVKISDGQNNSDNNGGAYWDFLVAGKGGVPVRSANYRAAISYYGNLPQELRRRTDFDKTLALLEKELSLYPANFQAKVALNSIRYDLKKIDSAAYYRSVGEMLGSTYDTSVESFVLSAVRMYGTAGQPEKGDSLRRWYIAQYPKSGLAEEQEVQALSAMVQDGAKFPAAARGFLAAFPANEYREQIQIAAVTHLLNAGKAEEAEQFLNAVRFPSPIAYATIARFYLAADSTLDDAGEVAQTAVDRARAPEIDTKPSHLAEFEWKEQTDITLGTVVDIYGQVAMKLQQNDRAIAAFTEALRLLGDNATPQHYDNMVKAFLNAGRMKEAYGAASSAIAASLASDYILAEHKKLYDEVMSKREAKGDGYESELARLEQAAAQARLRKLSSERLNMEPIEGSLTTLDGTTVSLADFAGKVVVIDFWATWCGPCIKSMPSLQEVYNKYRNNDKVQLLVVNVWERTQDRKGVASKFINDNKYTFPVYLDLNDEVVKKFGVTGIPTKFYIDREGRVQYREVGFKAPEEFKEYASSVIDLLLSEDFYTQQ